MSKILIACQGCPSSWGRKQIYHFMGHYWCKECLRAAGVRVK